MGQRLLITEEERNNIRQMYNLQTESYVFDSPHISIDGKYIIYNDELYDYSLNENLGNLFSIKNLKLLFENINPLLFEEKYYISEKIKTILNDKTINEKLLISEIKNSFTNGVITEENESNGGWLKQGVLMVARKVKSLLWSIGGMALDMFLVASGIGKAVQWIPWAICLVLDVYEWSTGDYENDEDKNSSPIWKALNIGFDILGMTVAGPVAKLVKSLFKPIQAIKSEAKISAWISKSPKALEFVKKINGGLSKVPSMMNELIKYLTTKMPKLAKWVNGLLSGITTAVSWISSILGKIITLPGKTMEKLGNKIQGTKLVGKNVGKGFKDATNVAAIGGGITGGIKTYQGFEQNKINTLLNAKSTYNNVKF